MAAHPFPQSPHSGSKLSWGPSGLWPRVSGITCHIYSQVASSASHPVWGQFSPSLPLQLGRLSVVRGEAGCSGEKWKGIKLNRGASHIPGGGGLLRPGWGGSRGGSSRLRGAPGTAGLTQCPETCEVVQSPWSPGWAGASASMLPGTTSGFFPPAHPGWLRAGRRGGLGESAPALLSQHPEEGRALASLPPPRNQAPKEQRSAAALDQSPKRSSP